MIFEDMKRLADMVADKIAEKVSAIYRGNTQEV